MPGVEIHAQLLENLYDGDAAHPPAVGAGARDRAVRRARRSADPRGAAVAHAGDASRSRSARCSCRALAAFAAFQLGRLLFDARHARARRCSLLFGDAARADARRGDARAPRAAHADAARARATARIAGELEAARRIQVAMLPRADLFARRAALDLAAAMVPAREVGGDLYDFFRLDGRRLFFLIGDVAGKGLSASIFMAGRKALYKSTTLRHPTPTSARHVARRTREMSRDNPRNAVRHRCSRASSISKPATSNTATPGTTTRTASASARGFAASTDGDGPPLCVVDDFAYRGEHTSLDPRRALVLVTDGVTEAQIPHGEMYGRARVEAMLDALAAASAQARSDLVDALRADVLAFAARRGTRGRPHDPGVPVDCVDPATRLRRLAEGRAARWGRPRSRRAF